MDNSASEMYPAAGSLLLLVVLFLLAATPLFRAADSPPTQVKHRIVTLDGLRGFLALAVVFSHFAIYHGFLQTRTWVPSPSHFYAALGPFGVSLFFMITGYLFWGRLLRDSGRLNWRTLYIGRVFRIGPLYMAAALVLLLGAGIETRWHRVVPWTALSHQIIRWLSLGLFQGMDVNGWFQASLLLGGVTWTVQWEWFFYLSLPVLALLARRSRLQLPMLLAILGMCVLARLTHPGNRVVVLVLPFVELFCTGMLSASLLREKRLPALPDWASSALVVICCALGLHVRELYSLGELLFFGIAFYLVTAGSTVFGLLTARPARRLGDISYGIYLLQGLAMDVVFRPHSLRPFALGPQWHFWLLCLLCSTLLLGMATAAHVWIERPGIEWGKRLARR